jgi:hypothetical protein
VENERLKGDQKGENMGIIRQETAAKIWQCYREIKAGKKLLQDMEELKEKHSTNPHAQHLKDAFGRGRNLQLGIPMGEDGHSLFGVSPELAKSVIKAHIANKEAELIAVNEEAHIEMN